MHRWQYTLYVVKKVYFRVIINMNHSNKKLWKREFAYACLKRKHKKIIVNKIGI